MKNDIIKEVENKKIYHKLTAEKETTYEGGKLVYGQTNAVKDTEYSSNIDGLIDGNEYIFENCVFNSPILINKNIDLVFSNCTFNQTVEFNSASNILINGCTFNTTNSNAILINVFSSYCNDITIVNNKFNTTATEGENCVLSIKTSVGNDTVRGRIYGDVIIENNSFEESSVVVIGSSPKGQNTTADRESGNFNLFIADNHSVLNLRNLFKFSRYDTIEDELINENEEYSQLRK